MNKYSQSIAHVGVDVLQDHRIVEVGRSLRRSSFPTSLLKNAHIEQAAQDHVLPGQSGTFAIDVFAYLIEVFWEQGFASIVSHQCIRADCFLRLFF